MGIDSVEVKFRDDSFEMRPILSESVGGNQMAHSFSDASSSKSRQISKFRGKKMLSGIFVKDVLCSSIKCSSV